MSDVKISAFSFDEEDSGILNLDSFALPGAIEKAEESTEAKETEIQKTDKKDEAPKKEVESFLVPGEEDKDITADDLFAPVVEEDKKVTPDKVDYNQLKDYFVETGVWSEWEGWEDTDLDEETFKKLTEAQAENKAKTYIEEEVSQFGETASQLMTYLKAGGNVETFLENHNQQLDIASIDISEEDGQEKVISTFYESIGKSKDWIKKQINRLKDEGEESFKEEAEDCKSKLKEELDSQREELIKEQVAVQKERQLQVEAFNKSIRAAIYSDKDLVDREQKELDKFLFDHKFVDDNGNKYSEFYKKFIEVQQDPKKYQKLVKFIKDIDNFENKEVTAKKVKSKVYNFIKGSAESLSTAESVTPQEKKQDTKIIKGFKF